MAGGHWATDRPRLRDPRADASLAEQGFAVLPGAARSSVRALRRLHRELARRAPAGFHSTIYSDDVAHKVEVHDRLVELLTPTLTSLFDDHRSFLANFVSKARGGSDSTKRPHQDWTFVDETDGASLNVWVPLVAVDRRNGCISVLPRSHLLAPTLRGTNTDDPFATLGTEVDRFMTELPMDAGDALVYDHRLLHGSPPNLRRRARLAVACAVVRTDAQLVHHVQQPDRVVRCYDIDDWFFVRHPFGDVDLPPEAVETARVDVANPSFSTHDLERLAGMSPSGGDR
jgi:Phytanoyl-CoA dioxygenase (PhyH)